jgi:hypothetical protein
MARLDLSQMSRARSLAGAHRPKANGHDYNSFEIVFRDKAWWWRPLTIPGLPDPELTGPFETDRAAYRDARAHSVEN